MSSLMGKVAVVTGAGRGIGKGIAKVLAEKGASVLITDVLEENARQAVQEIREAGGKADYVIADVSEEEGGKRYLTRP